VYIHRVSKEEGFNNDDEDGGISDDSDFFLIEGENECVYADMFFILSKNRRTTRVNNYLTL
jgi:hypothetical protein